MPHPEKRRTVQAGTVGVGGRSWRPGSEAAMAYRVQQFATVKYGHFGAYLKTVKDLEEIVRKRGWSSTRVLVPTVGANNEIVLENEYPDLASFQAENDAFYKDEEAFEIFRAASEHVVEGSARTALFEDVPMDFPGSD
jgi:hypothetical protein